MVVEGHLESVEAKKVPSPGEMRGLLTERGKSIPAYLKSLHIYLSKYFRQRQALFTTDVLTVCYEATTRRLIRPTLVPHTKKSNCYI